MPSLSAVRAANAAFSPSYIPVAIFVGGTSGIGQGVAEAFARHTHGNAHIILCGRNRAAAEAIIASFPKPTSPSALHEFVQCDASRMKNIEATTQELRARLPKVNFLVLSPGIMTMRGRNETPEGIDYKLALHYYARWKFTRDLLPLLAKAKDGGEDAKVLSVLAAGKGGPIDVNDLGLKKTFSLKNAALGATTYNDLMVESFAQQQPNIAFTHSYPGIVRTGLFSSSHWLLRPAAAAVTYATYPFSVDIETCGEYMLYALMQGQKGAYRRDEHGDDIGKKNYYGSDEERTRLWDHTVEEVDRASQS
ncbi:Oxidoreductase andH [Sparassis crispa]|uniref:Oxidoreductase andH n=1 Tax=Sparassis crispa TaxID=139825 RepID=A0A401H349_9APHY|nr:Oxidoreductase andH [Sparassis crispa]GBE88819.1 Oxidoreductase andH [Sparassis crispa]